MDYEKKEGSESSARERRIERVQSMLSGFDVAGMLFFEEANIRYLTGFAGSDGALLVSGAKTLLLVDGRYTTQAKDEAKGCDIIKFSDRMEGIAGIISDLQLKRVGIESPAIDLSSYLKLKDRVKGVSLKPLSGEIERIRMIKDGGRFLFSDRPQ